MPTPDTSGVPVFADFDMLKGKVNELISKYNNLLVNLDSLNVVSLTADHIDAGTLNAGVVTIRADLTGGAYIQIDSNNGLVINDGTKDTFHADINGFVTMTGALIQSSPSGYPKFVIDPSTNTVTFYASATQSIVLGAYDGGSGAPYIDLVNGADSVTIDLTSLFTIESSLDVALNSTEGVDITANNDVRVYPGSGKNIRIPFFSTLYSDFDGKDLQTALSEKATAGISTSSSGSANGGIPIGTQLAVNGGGFVTWTGIPSHTHTQN